MRADQSFRVLSAVLLMVMAIMCFPLHSAGSLVIDLTPIGNPRNDPDYRYPLGPPYDPYYRGSVSYEYSISTYEVTVAQYVVFLNAKAASDPYGLYNPLMMGGGEGSIISRSGSEGSYTYNAVPGTENQPVRYVSFYDGLRLANWLHNGQGDGDTETGSYDLSLGIWVTRSPGATWVLPSEDEWYKAAYYDPVFGVYYDYPHGSDDIPQEPTDETTPREMNFGGSPYWQGNVYFTSIGETTGRSPYGVYDLGGNVEEWTDSLVPPGQGSFRIVRGGSFVSDSSYLSYMGGIPTSPSSEGAGIGLRLVLIPEPSTVVLLLLGGPLLFMFRRRR